MLLFNNLDFLKRYELKPEDVYNLSNKKIDRLGKRLLYTIYAKEKGTTISRMTLADKREAKTNNVSFHSIRHAWMTKSVKEKGVEKTKAIIGHSDIKTTMGYTHMSQYETSKEYIKN
jgi:integrase